MEVEALRKALGVLVWVATASRPDLSQAAARVGGELGRGPTRETIRLFNQTVKRARDRPMTITLCRIDKPQLVTFDATGTIMRLAEPVGMHYREVLLKHTGLRLPRPSIFTMAFTEVYAARCDAMPCFGCGESVSSADWWVLAACAVTRPNKTFALCDRSQFLYTRASPGGRPSYATPT